MPKGEHFKKDNPRNHQVSFKVNKAELEKLRSLASADNLSIPQWLRSHIEGDNKPTVTAKKTPTAQKKMISKPKVTTEQAPPKGEQTSLF